MDMITLAMAKAYSDSKGGYAETKTIYPQTTVQCADVGDGVPAAGLEEKTLVVGETYTVTFDGKRYSCVCSELNAVGNNAIFGEGEDTGEPFLIILNGEDTFAIATQTEGTHTFSITQETIHPIDPKFLPGVCLPVVELTTVPTAKGAALTAEETAQVANALAMSNFAIIALPMELEAHPILCRVLTENDIRFLFGRYSYWYGTGAEVLMLDIMLGIIDGIGTAIASPVSEG